MTKVISFTSNLFDPAKEEPNPINPIAGQALLLWLTKRLNTSIESASQPDAEDWGWYSDVTYNTGTYMIGASGEQEPDEANLRWTIQVHRHRTLWQKITKKNQMTEEDPLAASIEALVRTEPAFQNIEVTLGR